MKVIEKDAESNEIAKQGRDLARQAIKLLRASEVSNSDAADLLRISKQRISQLTHS